jgi:hypothetical protein
MLPFIYVFSICVVAAILFMAVDEVEPNRRYALVLKFLIVFVSAVAIARRLMPQPPRGPAKGMGRSFFHKIREAQAEPPFNEPCN